MNSIEVNVFPSSKTSPLVRVIENRTLPLQKLSITAISDLEYDEDLLDEAAHGVVMQLVTDKAEKLIEEACRDEEVVLDPPIAAEEVDALAESAFEDVDADDFIYSTYDITTIDKITVDEIPGEAIMRNDEDDPFKDELTEIDINDDLDAVEAFHSDMASKYVEDKDGYHMTEENKRKLDNGDKPNGISDSEEDIKLRYGRAKTTRIFNKSETVQQAAEKGSLQYLKSVEGRVLTIMEVAFPDATQREAVKSLIKKEFRREMNKVNRTDDED